VNFFLKFIVHDCGKKMESDLNNVNQIAAANRQKDLDAILNVLDYSDIVWTKYGSETKQDLALKILKALTNGVI